MSGTESTVTGPSSTQPLRTTKETHPNLPPGLILGPDGKVCKVCNSWQDFAKTKVKKKDGTGTGIAMGMGAFAGMMSGAKNVKSGATSTPTLEEQQVDRRDCPADNTLLGRSTWTFLHTTAAYYPISAPRQTQDNMRALLVSLSLLYPCGPCATDFRENIRQTPPDLSGREGLSRWLCERHNEVNEKLGKERFDCDWKNLDARWKDGPADGRCD
ncbi:ERV/ALR sulfhydryl oxidase domain-containing protein [Naematelia encephala]|uniref:Sulfhydryl oxidase n=1 Tax=Naematelia encephala TaxID=71784 RepID=A0A1Y2B0Y6_9TREE|nr:ERV/ALR sulfhydryl oxidase domain-containing protein [Naematelia encephala]